SEGARSCSSTTSCSGPTTRQGVHPARRSRTGSTASPSATTNTMPFLKTPARVATRRRRRREYSPLPPDSDAGPRQRSSARRPAVAQHLRVLLDAGLVTEQRHGRERRYRLVPAQLGPARGWMAYDERFWDDHLQPLQKQLSKRSKA